MILFTSFLHRRELRDIIGRWLVDRPDPEDVRRLKEIVNFNAVYVGRVLRSFADELFADLHGPVIRVVEARTKGELKELMIQNPPYKNARIETLIRRFREHPERYFRESPFAGSLFAKGPGHINVPLVVVPEGPGNLCPIQVDEGFRRAGPDGSGGVGIRGLVVASGHRPRPHMSPSCLSMATTSSRK